MMTGDPRIIEDDVVIGIAADSDDLASGAAPDSGHGMGTVVPRVMTSRRIRSVAESIRLPLTYVPLDEPKSSRR